MARCMAGHLENPRSLIAEGEGLVLADLDVDAGNSRRVASGADDGAAGGPLDLEIAADVVHVVMGAEDMGQAPSLARPGP